jgi:hypothetical protein
MKHLRIVAVLVSALVAATCWADELQTLSGKKVTGTLEKITDTTITLKSDGKSVDIASAQALELNLRPTKAPAGSRLLEVMLIDDSKMLCTKVSFTAKEAQLELTTGLKVAVPLTALATVLRDADDPDIRKQWAVQIGDKVRKDRIFFLKDGVLQGLKGVIGAIDEKDQKVKFKGEDGVGEIEPALDKLQAMQFLRTDALEQAGLCYVVDLDGNKLVASKLGYDGSKVSVTTPFGHKVALDPQLVAKFDFNLGRLTYLSDLEEKLAANALLGGFNALRKNRNLDGGDIILQDKKYDKGLSMYAGVELEYSLNEKYRDFKALLGVDSRIAEEGQGKVTVSIYCDGEKRNSFEVSVKAPTPIAINVKDVKTLRIVVSGSNFTNYSGHAMLANAHVSQ